LILTCKQLAGGSQQGEKQKHHKGEYAGLLLHLITFTSSAPRVHQVIRPGANSTGQ